METKVLVLDETADDIHYCQSFFPEWEYDNHYITACVTCSATLKKEGDGLSEEYRAWFENIEIYVDDLVVLDADLETMELSEEIKAALIEEIKEAIEVE